MALARRPLDPPLTLEGALATLHAGDGAPLPVEVGGKVVAYLLTPEEFERMEDERDLAILRAARAEHELSGEPTTSLQEVAAQLGIDLHAAE